MIYIVEDDPDIRELEVYALKSGGYDVNSFGNGAAFLSAFSEKMPQLVLLDIMLPDIDGYELLKKVRKLGNIPVIMVTAKSSEIDKLKGFDVGADDYVCKPFSVMELTARVGALMRRSGAVETAVVSAGDISVDSARRTVSIEGKIIKDFRYKEFELLRFLIKNPERVHSRDELMNIVWGLEYVGESRTVDMHIRSIRQKLGAFADMIQTVRNVGYKLVYEKKD
ncbi:MAG: response regulator transcription factor [Deferribacteraceae bacterium]|nr:response regulator transcription factor [Deferribacteraceae bacterium]